MTLSEIRKGIYNKLAANAGVKAKLGDPVRIYNKVPNTPTKPYARLKILTDAPWDTIGKTGNNTTVTVDVFADNTNDGTVEDAGDAIYAALHRQSITVTGKAVVMCVYELGEIVGDPDPAVQHYTSRYRVLSNPA